jgi:hypothetical protein
MIFSYAAQLGTSSLVLSSLPIEFGTLLAKRPAARSWTAVFGFDVVSCVAVGVVAMNASLD